MKKGAEFCGNTIIDSQHLNRLKAINGVPALQVIEYYEKHYCKEQKSPLLYTQIESIEQRNQTCHHPGSPR